MLDEMGQMRAVAVEWVLLILLLILVLFVVIQAVRLLKAKRRQAMAAPPLAEVLPDETPPQPRMLFYFYSEHCGHCRGVTPLVEEIRRRHDGVVMVDVRRQMAVARRFGVQGTPSLVRVDDGLVSDVHVGAINQRQLQRFFPS